MTRHQRTHEPVYQEHVICAQCFMLQLQPISQKYAKILLQNFSSKNTNPILHFCAIIYVVQLLKYP